MIYLYFSLSFKDKFIKFFETNKNDEKKETYYTQNKVQVIDEFINR